MEKFWSPLSWNWDRHNLEYLSSIEAVNYPFVGVQFHPEKNIYEWSVKEPRIPHSKWVSTILKILRSLNNFSQEPKISIKSQSCMCSRRGLM